ncbi:hypothetical protein BH10BAC2_BH10BAC2_15870 [soil metagenome]
MDTEIKASLHDILNAITEVERFFDDTANDFAVYQNEDPEIKHSVEAHIETIGDALKAILQKDPAIQLPDATKILDAQNLIHNDHNAVTDEMVWSIVINYLETLKIDVGRLLDA